MAYRLHSIILNSLELSQDANILQTCNCAQSLFQLQAEYEKRWAELIISKEKYYNIKHQAKLYEVRDKVWLFA